MDFTELVAKAEAALSNDDLYLTSFMCQLSAQNDQPQWHLHFYSPLDDSMYTYDSTDGSIAGPNEVLKQNDFVPELELANVKVTYEEALKKAFEAALPEKDFVRIIVLLQVVDETETWNITFMNQQFHSLNVRVDAVSGRVVAREAFELFTFDSGDQEA